MASKLRPSPPPGLPNLAALASLLDRLERRPRVVSADQYRDVVLGVTQLLTQVEPGPALEAVLQGSPAAAELYENLNYRHAGLVRSPLDAALAAEQAALAAIQKAGAR